MEGEKAPATPQEFVGLVAALDVNSCQDATEICYMLDGVVAMAKRLQMQASQQTAETPNG